MSSANLKPNHASPPKKKKSSVFVESSKRFHRVTVDTHMAANWSAAMAKAEWAKTTALINVAVSILERQYPMTIRQLFYQIVSRGVILNNLSCYKMVSRVMGKARKDGRCAWKYITDRSRPEYAPNVFKDAQGYAEVVRRSYRKDYWALQPNHVEVWTEKDAIIGSIEPLTNELGITVRVGRGFNSTTKRHEIEVLFRQIARNGKGIYVLYLGDHDPSGMAIEKNLREEIDADFSIERIAIHQTDIRKFNLPPLRVKESDSRSADFVIKHGPDCVELDALPPNELRSRISDAVHGLMDMAKWERAIAVEKVELASIISSVELWNKAPVDDEPWLGNDYETAKRIVEAAKKARQEPSKTLIARVAARVGVSRRDAAEALKLAETDPDTYKEVWAGRTTLAEVRRKQKEAKREAQRAEMQSRSLPT